MRIRRTPYFDEYVDPDGVAVLVEGKVVVVSPLAGELLRGLSDSWSPDQVVADRLEAMYGAPPGGDTLGQTRAAVRELAAQGLLEVREDDPGADPE